MILRDALISDERRALTSTRVERTVQVDRERPAAHHMVTTAATCEPEPSAPVVEPKTEMMPSREARLTFESVAAWLAVQDVEIRTACASLLTLELAQVHENAKAEGYAAGHLSGQEAARQELDKVYLRLQNIVQAAESAFAREEEKLADTCVEIVAETFGKIAGSVLTSREAVLGAVLEVLKRVKEGRELIVRVNSTDLVVLQNEEERLAAVLPGRKFSLAADSRVDIGGCIVESKSGTLDGRLEAQLRELYETLRAAKAAQMEVS